MQEKNLFRISLAMIILGLGFLFFYSESMELETVERIDSELPKEYVKIKGTLTRVSDQEKVSFLELQGEQIETVNVILFKEEEIFLKEGDYVEIEGTVEDYEGKKEIIANKIILK